MLYNIIEVSESIGISKKNIYKKLQKKELKKYIIKQQGITYIDDIAFNLIKNGPKVNTEDLNTKEENNPLDIETVECIVNGSLNKEVFNTLLKQLKEKDIQIHELNKSLKKEQILNKNNQILIKKIQSI